MKKNLVDELSLRQAYLEKEVLILEKRLSSAPEGRLRIGKSNDITQYYIVDDSTSIIGKYLSADHTETIKALAQKSYDKKELTNARKEKKLLDPLVSFLRKKEDIFEGLSPKRKALVTPYDIRDDEYARNWLSDKYERKGFNESSKQYLTESGCTVRSKSEAMIADILTHEGIPFKYEKPYRMSNGLILRPDFTILNKRTREEFLLEHFGMMDDEKYRDSFFDKLHIYTDNGILPGVNLFLSFEGNKTGHEFNGQYIKRLIKEVFR